MTHQLDRVPLRELWPVALLYGALTFALAFPLSIHPADRVLSATPDTELFLWTLSWDAHAFTRPLQSIFDANIYYPERHTLAYSENLIGGAALVAPVLWLTGNPVLAMNLLVLGSSMLCGLGMYLLARRAGLGEYGATLAGVIFAFSPPRFLRLDQVHLATIQWVPFGLASLVAYFDGGRRRDAWLTAAFFTLQALSSGHGAVFLALGMLVFFTCRVVGGRHGTFVVWLRDLGVPGALLLLPTALMIQPYLAVQNQVGLRRGLDNWSVPWSSFLASPAHVPTFLLSFVPAWHPSELDGPALFAGILPVVLAGVALTRRHRRPADGDLVATAWTGVATILDVAALGGLSIGSWVAITGVTRLRVGGTVLLTATQPWRIWLLAAAATAMRAAIARRAPFLIRRRLRRWAHDPLLPYVVLTIICLWLSAGRPVGLWPLVYWLPGLNFIRAPSRFVSLAVLGIAMLAGAGFERLAVRFSHVRQRALALGVGAILVAEFMAAPLALEPYRVVVPAVDRWLSHQPQPFAVAEVPVGDPGEQSGWERRETMYMLHSTGHWQNTVHGYSGWRPRLQEELLEQLTTFPDEQSLRGLVALRVDYVVVHPDLYPTGAWPAVEDRIARAGQSLKLEHTEDSGRVYSVHQAR